MPDGRIAFERQPRTQRATWFIDMHRVGNLILDPPYQRRKVWSKKFKQFFIDSVIRNFPTSSIFLATDIGSDGRTRYEVIDGKQRLTTILEFIADDFPAPESLETLGLSGMLFSAMPEWARKSVFSYIFNVEEISDYSSTELDQVFERLNRNTMQLKKQELRHAQYYDSEFLKKFEVYAEHPFWEKAGVVTVARARRMLDVELVSELYVLTERGVQDGNEYLETVYAEYDDDIPDMETVDERFDDTIRYLEDVCDRMGGFKSTRLKNTADFYSLWGAVLSLRELPAADVAANRLSGFLSHLDNNPEAADALAYLDAARQGSNKKSNRELRMAQIAAALLGTPVTG